MGKRKITAKEIVSDVRLGLTNSQLMAKYQLRVEALRYICTKLVDAGLMTELELYERTNLTESEVFRAFSEASEPVLKCARCGSRLPEEGEECLVCRTVSYSGSR
jgi:hypothetical protein